MKLFKRKRSSPQPLATPSVASQLPDVDTSIIEIIESVLPFTMTSPERIAALCQAVQHITDNSIEGDIVECGVWKGGSMMAATQQLIRLENPERRLWLYDTYEGMTEPSQSDVDFLGRAAEQLLSEEDRDDPKSIWCCSQLEQVQLALNSTGYKQDLINYIVGPVESTIPDTIPDKIALLRLDTDWYESTRHELIHLFPRMTAGAVLIIDDYGHWEGCRRAVDEYFAENNVTMFLNRIDYTGRIGIHYPTNRSTASAA